MRTLVYAINITPDGFCDHTAVTPTDDLHRYYSRLLKNADLAVFGRVTFELFESYWPAVAKHGSGSTAENEFARLMDEIPKIVFSKTLKKSAWKNTTICSEHPDAEILKLKALPGKTIYMAGSPCLAACLMKKGLIDHYHFCIQPVISGSGKRFFETDALEKRITLKSFGSRPLESGVIVQTYHQVEEPTAPLDITLQASF